MIHNNLAPEGQDYCSGSTMRKAPNDRYELEDVWRKRVKQAWDSYLRCQDRAVQVLAMEEKISHLGSDGIFLLRQVRRLELNALQQYARVLKIYTDLVVHDVVPDESD